MIDSLFANVWSTNKYFDKYLFSGSPFFNEHGNASLVKILLLSKISLVMNRPFIILLLVLSITSPYHNSKSNEGILFIWSSCDSHDTATHESQNSRLQLVHEKMYSSWPGSSISSPIISLISFPHDGQIYQSLSEIKSPPYFIFKCIIY